MFTGIVEETGLVTAAQRAHGTRRFSIYAKQVAADLAVDDSIAVNGVCLTVVKTEVDTFDVQAVAETISKTTLGELQRGARVNLERAMRFSDRLGGHLVQGHVDGVGEITVVSDQDGGRLLTIRLPELVTKYVISEGSIAIDGVSLTVARLVGSDATISLIPHTLEKTTLAGLGVADRVNIEVDLIGKYVEKLLGDSRQSKITEAWLQKVGYDIS